MIDFALVLKLAFLLNPLSSIPVLFLAHKQKLDVKTIAFRSTILGYAVAIVFVILGPLLFNVYGISLDAFRAAGGLVILLLGLSMARDTKTYSEETSDALISLIATPLLTGPATLSFAVLKAAEIGITSVLVNVTAAFAIVGSLFVFAASMIPNINLEHVRFISRLLGLFLIALGIEMIGAGIKSVLFG